MRERKYLQQNCVNTSYTQIFFCYFFQKVSYEIILTVVIDRDGFIVHIYF